MVTQIEQAISNLNSSSVILEQAATRYMNIDDAMSYYLDQMSASMRSHSTDLSNLMSILGEL